MKVIPILFLLLRPMVLHGQDSVSIPKRVIKFSPPSLINEFPTLQLAYEHRIGKKITVQLDAGYVLDFWNNGEKSDKRGFKLREEVRYYYKIKSYNRKDLKYSKASYLAFEFSQKIINYNDVYTELCYDESCPTTTYLVKLREPGLNFKIGFTEYLSRFILDFNIGLSCRFIRYERAYPSQNDTVDILGFLFLLDVPEHNENMVTPTAGFRVGYLLGK